MGKELRENEVVRVRLRTIRVTLNVYWTVRSPRCGMTLDVA